MENEDYNFGNQQENSGVEDPVTENNLGNEIDEVGLLKHDAVQNGMEWDDFKLPTASVLKVIKDTLPITAIISREGKSIFNEIAAIFISYITECSTTFSAKKKRKTLLPIDIIDALKEYNFDSLLGQVESMLAARNSKSDTEKDTTSCEQISADQASGNDGSNTPSIELHALNEIRDVDTPIDDFGSLNELVEGIDNVLLDQENGLLENQTSQHLGTAFMDSDDEQ